MTALAPAFHSVDQRAGLNLNHRKCCWVPHGSESFESLLNCSSDNCEDFREMQAVKYAKNVGTMIGPNGHKHLGKIHSAGPENQRLCDLNIYALSVLEYIWSLSALDKATLTAEAMPLVYH